MFTDVLITKMIENVLFAGYMLNTHIHELPKSKTTHNTILVLLHIKTKYNHDDDDDDDYDDIDDDYYVGCLFR